MTDIALEKIRQELDAHEAMFPNSRDPWVRRARLLLENLVSAQHELRKAFRMLDAARGELPADNAHGHGNLAAQVAWLRNDRREARQQLCEAIDTAATNLADYERACQTIARMHAAAVGEITGPRSGVIEDVQDVAAALQIVSSALDLIVRDAEGCPVGQGVCHCPSPDDCIVGVAMQEALRWKRPSP
jgi:hypothetical protein